MAPQLDYLIVGAGLYGATFARLAADHGKSCLVVDRRKHIAGNCYTKKQYGIDVHKYGAHLFHTNNENVWRFVNRFGEFNRYCHQVIVKSGEMFYSFPPNKMTYQQLGTEDKQVVYDKLFKGYTKKMWGKEQSDAVKRIPIRNDWDNRYFSDKYQGVPINGYTRLVEQMLSGIEVRLNCPYCYYQPAKILAKRTIYTGSIDDLFDYKYGQLLYRSIRFKSRVYNKEQQQGTSVINYADEGVSCIRTVEHKYFNWTESKKTIVTTEYPTSQGEGMYPVLDLENIRLYNRYKKLLPKSFVLGGRLGSYKYMDMDDVIEQAMDHFKEESL